MKFKYAYDIVYKDTDKPFDEFSVNIPSRQMAREEKRLLEEIQYPKQFKIVQKKYQLAEVKQVR